LRTAFGDLHRRRHGDVYVSPQHRLLCGLISTARSLMLSKTAYVFRPSPPPSLPLTRCFTLRYVTATSSAPGFTITTASSAGPRPITDHVSASL